MPLNVEMTEQTSTTSTALTCPHVGSSSFMEEQHEGPDGLKKVPVKRSQSPQYIQQQISRHRAAFHTQDPSTHSVVIAYDTDYVGEVVEKRFSAEERAQLQSDAEKAYHARCLANARRELEQLEQFGREDLEKDMTLFFEAFIGWQTEIRENLFGRKTLQRALRRLQERLDDRGEAIKIEEENEEERLKALGREAWKKEVEQTYQLEREEQQRLAAERERLTMERRAMAFLLGEEHRQREYVVQACEAAVEALGKLQVEERTRLEEEESQLLMLSLADVKGQLGSRFKQPGGGKRQKLEQEKLRSSCTHGPKHTSLFIGPNAKKICPRCRIRVDPVTNFLVRIDAAAGKASSHPSTTAKEAAPTKGEGRGLGKKSPSAAGMPSKPKPLRGKGPEETLPAVQQLPKLHRGGKGTAQPSTSSASPKKALGLQADALHSKPPQRPPTRGSGVSGSSGTAAEVLPILTPSYALNGRSSTHALPVEESGAGQGGSEGFVTHHTSVFSSPIPGEAKKFSMG